MKMDAGSLSLAVSTLLIVSCTALSSLSKSYLSYTCSLLLIIRIINKRFIESQQCLLEESVYMCVCVCVQVCLGVFVCSRRPLSIVNRHGCCHYKLVQFLETCTSGLCLDFHPQPYAFFCVCILVDVCMSMFVMCVEARSCSV